MAGSTSKHSRLLRRLKALSASPDFELSEIVPTLEGKERRPCEVLFIPTIIGGPIKMSHAQDDGGSGTLASLAGKFAARGSGFQTVCFNA